MAHSVESLTHDVAMLGNQFKANNTQHLIVGLKDARKMFLAAGQNALLFKAAMKDAGVSSMDTRIMLGKLNAELTQTRRAALGMDGIWAKMFNPRSIWAVSHALNVASKGIGAIQTVAGAIASPIGAASNMAYDYGSKGVGSVIDAATARQNQIASMSYMLEKPGTSEKEATSQAKELFAWAQKYAKATPLDTSQITGAFGQFLTAEFNPRQSKILTQIMADQSSKFMDRPEMGHNVISAFSRVKGQGTASAESLESMRVAGMNEKKIMEALRELPDLQPLFKGINSRKNASDEEKAHETKKVLSTGKISSDSFIQATINALEKDRPDVGKMAEKLGGESLAGTISNLKSAWEDLLQSVDLQNWPGVKQLQSFMTRISTALDSSTESGKHLLKTVEKAMNNLFEGLNTIEQSDIDGFVSRIGEAALDLTKWLKDAWGWFDRLIHSDASFLDSVQEALIDVGIFIGQGIWKGVTQGGKELTEERFSRKHHGLRKEEAEYFAKTQGKTVDQVAAEFDKKHGIYTALGGKVPEPGILGSRGAEFSAHQEIMGIQAPMFDMVHDTMYGVGVMGAQGFIAGAKGPDGLDAHSPSRAMMEIGEMGAQGLMKGASGGMGSVGGSREVNLTINAGSGDAASQWEALRPTIQRELTAIMTRVAGEA